MVKRIAMLTDNADPLVPLGGIEAGGENVYVLELSRALGRLGWTVDVFTRWSSQKTNQIAKISTNVRVIRLQAGPIEFVPKEQLAPLMTKYVDSFLSFREKHKLEYLLIHGNYYHSGVAGVEIARLLKLPMVNTFHTLGLVRRAALGAHDVSADDRIAKEKLVMDSATRVIATSPPMKEEMMHMYGVTAKKIAVVTEGVNLKRFTPVAQNLARRVLHLDVNSLLVLFVGRMERRKGVDTLLWAIKDVADRLGEKRKLLTTIISGGETKKHWKRASSVEKVERERLYALVEKLGIGDVVKFIGGVDREELPFYYSAADVTAVPSFYEPFGLVPLESMACGTPVVASKVGGMMWTIRDSVTGYLVTARDHHAFGDRIYELLTTPETGKRMRENGIDRVRHLFTWEEVASQMSVLYTDLIIEYLYRQAKGA